jgi:signal transduction histidine kinase
MLRRTAASVVGAAIFAAVTTALVAFLPVLHFAYRQHELHVGFETAAALVGVLASYLLFGRFRRRRRLDDLLLFIAFSLFALANLFFAAIPAMVVDAGSSKFSTWTALSGRSLGAMAFAAAAFVPSTRVHLSRRTTALVLSAPMIVMAATALVVGPLVPALPSGVEAEFLREASGRPHLSGHWAVLGVQLVGAILFAAATVGFVRRNARERDVFVAVLAAASVFAAFARVNYFLYPSLYTEWVYTGDAFRLLFYAVILLAALTEISSYWKFATQAAVLDERRRIARDLHDGLAQELALVGRSLKRLDPENMFVQRASAGVERGLEDARRAIAALSDPIDEPLDVTLGRVARDVAAREGTTVALALASGIQAPAEARDAFTRILSEAITNAARHGHADLVRVELENGRRVRLRISDTGRGFDPDAEGGDSRGSFGLRGMRERVQSLGGELRLVAEPGRGTQLEIVL